MAKSTTDSNDFAAAFAGLKKILTPYAKKWNVVKDTETEYSLDNNLLGTSKRPICFAMVRTGKSYVSFHLMPVYMNPKLQAMISANLKKRMQGKACFNFAEPDAKLFAELKALTKAGVVCFKKMGFE